MVFSFGVGRDLSFECAMIERFGATVHAFDPTPLAIEWARAQRLPDRLVLRELGLADYDGMARFIPSRRVGGENFSMVRTTGIGDPIEAPVRRFATLAALVGAGGLGDPIVAGLALADTRMILSGAVPAALLALLVDAALGWVQAHVTPAGPRAQA